MQAVAAVALMPLLIFAAYTSAVTRWFSMGQTTPKIAHSLGIGSTK